MKRIFLVLTALLVITFALVSCDKFMDELVGVEDETTSVNNITTEEKVNERETEPVEDQTSEIITDKDIAKIDINRIVKDGKVIKKHDPALQVWSATMGDYRVHLGIDIECENWATVFSMIDGEVTKIWYDALMGDCVAISNGTYTVVYKNLSAKGISVKEGEKVEIRQSVGQVGDSAVVELADPSHLHLELFKNDVCIDPLEYIIIQGETGNETETENETEETTEAEIAEVELDVIVKGGKVSKKHDPDTPIFSESVGDYRVHIGIDIECKENSPVYAMFDGEVTKIWSDALMGNCIAISNGTYVVIYKNLADNTVEGIIEGTKVETGQMIGYVGASALLELADEPHLHLELTQNDCSIDPLEYIIGGVENEDETETETETEEVTEETTEAEIAEVDIDTIVAGGKVAKKHDPYTQVWSPTMGDYRVHIGIDIECEMNAPVYSMIDGQVDKIWYDPLMGNCLAISNGTYVVIYKNLADQTENGIEEGSKVSVGQMIGQIGDSAMIELAEEPHLHLEMTKDDISIDPLKYIVE